MWHNYQSLRLNRKELWAIKSLSEQFVDRYAFGKISAVNITMLHSL